MMVHEKKLFSKISWHCQVVFVFYQKRNPALPALKPQEENFNKNFP
jgi:hypothetical protein